MWFNDIEQMESFGDNYNALEEEAKQYGLTASEYIAALFALDDDYMASNGHLWD